MSQDKAVKALANRGEMLSADVAIQKWGDALVMLNDAFMNRAERMLVGGSFFVSVDSFV